MSLLSALFGNSQAPAPDTTGGLGALLGQQAQPQSGTGLGGIIGRALGGITNPTNPISQFGHALTIASGGNLGNALAYMDQQQRQGQDDQLDRVYRLAQIQKALQPEKPDFQTVGDQYGTVDSSGKFNPQGTVERAPTGTAALYDLWNKETDPAKKAMLGRILPGAAYDPETIAAKQADALALIAARTQGQIQAKQTPSASSGARGGGVTANKRADIIAQAQRAIQAGADPAKVHARVAQLGVQF